MRIGVPKETKDNEYRVALTPSSAGEIVAHGHEVLVQSEAGSEAGFRDSDYQSVGATMLNAADAIFARADMIVKVKEPTPAERRMLWQGQLLFTYLAPCPRHRTNTGSNAQWCNLLCL